MAGAMRPAVLLMLLAALLFLVAGVLDGVYPGGSYWSLSAYDGLGWTSYLFAGINGLLAVLIARGSERMLALRIILAAFFVIERPVSAFALGPKSLESVVVHLITAALELQILVASVMVWRLGRSLARTDVRSLLGTTPAGEGPAAPR